MQSTTFRILAGMLASLILGASSGVHGESEVQPVSQTAAQLTAEQLDQMLAPIALYPDPLVAQILMAATYPLEVVEADRWVQQPGNAGLQGGQLTDALEQQPWDPSVKSLVPFPQVLKMLDGNIEWTEHLGDAFLASNPAVMDSIQRLRQRAQAAGTLQSIPEEAVNQVGQDITIQPANADTVYVPVYNPTVAYGAWPYPAYPPYYFPDDFYSAVPGPFGFRWVSVAVVVPLWGWGHCDWHRHHIDLDRARFAALHGHHPRPGVEWTHDPWHRHGVPYGDLGVQSRFASNAASADARPAFRGNPAALAFPSSRTAPDVAGMPGGAHSPAAPVPAPQVPHAQTPRVWTAPRTEVTPAPPIPHAQTPQVWTAPRAQVPQPPQVPHTQTPREWTAPRTEVTPAPPIPHAQMPQVWTAPRAQVPQPPQVPHTETPRVWTAPRAVVPAAPQVPHVQMPQAWAPRAQEPLSPQVSRVQAPQVLRAPPAQMPQPMPRPTAVMMPHVAPGFVPSGRSPGMQTPAMPGRLSGMPAPVFRPGGGVTRPVTSNGARTN
ncbi:hypothetical protein BH160DRAFT_0069 [Burkholderia sp. H160]|nr:hypothetical protein BH160DRAFT_0069 [Burkholderia sp. H160]